LAGYLHLNFAAQASVLKYALAKATFLFKKVSAALI
jgi:hypothetical protein